MTKHGFFNIWWPKNWSIFQLNAILNPHMYCASEFPKILGISNPMLLGNLKMWNFVPEWHKGIFNIEGTQIAPKCTFFRPRLSLMNTQVPACHPVTKYFPGNIVFPNKNQFLSNVPEWQNSRYRLEWQFFTFLHLLGYQIYSSSRSEQSVMSSSSSITS